MMWTYCSTSSNDPAGLRLRFAYKERLTETFGSKISLGTRYPVFWANATRGFNDLLDGQYAFDKIDLRMLYDFRLKHFGAVRLIAEAGNVWGDTPVTELTFGSGSYTAAFGIVADNTFQTMRLYEFLAQRYVRVFYTHELATFQFGKTDIVKPTLEVSHNALYGTIDNPQVHRGIDFTAPEKGYHETGLIIRNALRIYYGQALYLGLGGGLFYRHGAYAFDDPVENMAWKFDLALEF